MSGVSEKNLALSRAGGWQRLLPWAVWCGAVVVWGIAVWARFSLPPVPVFTSDSLGYAGPGLNHIVHGNMPQIHQRDFFYPLLLRGMMVWGADMAWVTFVQHVLGLLSGILWWVIWIRWCARQSHFWVREAVGPGAGLLLLAIYLWNGHAIFLEHTIRPEAVFPFFALAQIGLTVGAVRLACTPSSRLWMIFLCAAGMVVFGLAATDLKPSWTLSWLALAFGGALVLRVQGVWSRRAWNAMLGMVVGFLLWQSSMMGLQKWVDWREESASSEFLAKTLVSVHAREILEFWEPKKGGDQVGAEDVVFLEKLRKAMEDSRLRKHSYPVLDFDPDYIFYRTRVLTDLPMPVEVQNDYLMRLYTTMLWEAPWLLVPKVAQQLRVAYFIEPGSLYTDRISRARSYGSSVDDVRYLFANYQPGQFDLWIPYREKTEYLAENWARETRVSPTVNAIILQVLRFSLVPGLLVGVGVGIVLLARPTNERLFYLECAMWAFFSLGAVATVAIVHSFDIERYLHNITFLQLLVIGGGWVCFAEWGAQWGARKVSRRGARRSAEMGSDTFRCEETKIP